MCKFSVLFFSGPDVLIVTGVYKSPNYPADEFLALLGDHMTKLKSKEAAKHVICGDFNINVFLEDRKLSKLIKKLSYFGFQLKNNRMATKETTCSKTCIDLVFSNFKGVCNVDKTALSDHYNVFFSANFFASPGQDLEISLGLKSCHSVKRLQSLEGLKRRHYSFLYTAIENLKNFGVLII